MGNVPSTFVQGFVNWTDSDTEGLVFGALTGLYSDSVTGSGNALNDSPRGTGSAAGKVELDFTYRPNPVFSFIGGAEGLAESDAYIADGNGGVTAQGSNVAIGQSGSMTDAPAPAQAWMAGNTYFFSQRFDAEAMGRAISPAALGQDDTPGTSMTVGTQYGSYSAAMGSSSATNAEAEATLTISGVTNPSSDDFAFATAFGFAEAAQDRDNAATAGTPPVTLYDLDSEHAFTGQGTLVGVVPDDPDAVIIASAANANLFGTASSPLYSGSLDNGDSATDIRNDDDGEFQRTSTASADSLTASNYPNAVAHNRMFGNTPEFDSDAAPWWGMYGALGHEINGQEFDHLAFGFIGGGGK